MKTTASSALILILGIWASPGFCAAKDPGGVPEYDVKTEVEFTGSIVKMYEVAPDNALPDLYLTIHTSTDSFEIYLGPASFIKRLDVPLRVGLKDVGVTGSKVKFAGSDLVLARELRVGKILFSLRDKKGFPNWLWNYAE
jgi:hypothetical protein